MGNATTTINTIFGDEVKDVIEIAGNSGALSFLDDDLEAITSLSSAINIANTYQNSAQFEFGTVSGPTPATIPNSKQQPSTGVSYSIDILNNTGALNLYFITSALYTSAAINTFITKGYLRKLKASGSNARPTSYSRGITTGPMVGGVVVGYLGSPDPGTSSIGQVTSTAQTGILGISVLSAQLTTSTLASGAYWLFQTGGQFFDANITGATVGAPVYYDATGTPTLTAAGNVRFGTILSSDITGSWIEIDGFTQ